MTSHSQHNNVEGATTAAEHNKRVSFGAEEHVQMIVYDDGLNDDYSIGNHNNRLPQLASAAGRHIFTEPDAPPSRVRVHAEQAEIPRPISPPAHIAPVPVDATIAAQINSTASTAPSSSAAAAAAIGHQSPGGPGPPAAQMVQMVNSPPLPSFIKRAEHDNENPFRPDEQLYHEVDPIVEMYRQRPFPPSPSHGSPVPPHQATPTRQPVPSSSSSHHHHQPTSSSSTATTTPSRAANEIVANGGGGGGGSGRHSSLAEARRETQQQANSSNQQPLLDSSGADGLGPPGRVEVVRLEKKKRACCSLQ